MRILVATDAWRPQVNGVVRTYERLEQEVKSFGAEFVILSPSEFRSLPCPTYPQIRLAVPDFARAARFIDNASPDAIHIATEGPVGWMAQAYCRANQRPFTTSFHTRFAEYASQRASIPESWIYAGLRRFHNRSSGVMVATDSLAVDLTQRGFKRLMPWTRGVDTELFRPRDVRHFGSGPVFLYVGRVAIEKNIEAFLSLPLPGRKVVVGDGPHLNVLKRRFPGVIFAGECGGEQLAEAYASADVFVFPSRTDTFGMVILEALASGLPVAAFPVTGPRDIVVEGVSGVLSEDLRAASLQAMMLDPAHARARALAFSWSNAARLFLANVYSALDADQVVAAKARSPIKIVQPGAA